MELGQSNVAQDASRNAGSGEHALVLVAIFTIFAIATVVSIIVPQALDIAANHANSARLLLIDAEEIPAERYEREARGVGPERPVF